MATAVTSEEFLTVAEVAARLRCSPVTVYRRIHDGSIPAVRIGNDVGLLRIPARELEARLFASEGESATRRSLNPAERGAPHFGAVDGAPPPAGEETS